MIAAPARAPLFLGVLLLLAGASWLEQQPVRIHGTLVPGSRTAHAFIISTEEGCVDVSVPGVLPDTLCDGKEVWIEGVRAGSAIEARTVIARSIPYRARMNMRCGP